jgi:hypothetical protein
MQERRRREKPPVLTPDGISLTVPEAFWNDLKERDLRALCNVTLAVDHEGAGLRFPSVGVEILLDLQQRCLKRLVDGEWRPADDPRLELLALLYFNRVDVLYPLGREPVGPGDLKEAHYFQGPHALNMGPFLERYGNDVEGFKRAAERLEGKPVDMADAAFMLLPFPRVPVYFLLWEGDEEFHSKASVLFDRSVEKVFSASSIWVLVDMMARALVDAGM